MIVDLRQRFGKVLTVRPIDDGQVFAGMQVMKFNCAMLRLRRLGKVWDEKASQRDTGGKLQNPPAADLLPRRAVLPIV